jgi:hypothetical protein
MMNEILTSIDSEISILKQARALLTGNSASRGGPVSSGHTAKRKFTMSAEGREKIAAAQRKRWAKQKKAAK